MEGLHVALEDAISMGYINPITLGSLKVSHLFFADDVLLVGKWSRNNVQNIIHILKCFYEVSGLLINMDKSNLFGVGVHQNEVLDVAEITGCCAQKLPFVYLGIPIQMNMSLCASWKPIQDKFLKSLSNWKQSTLSVGGRSTLGSFVLGALGSYYFSLFPMPSKVNSILESIKSKFFWGKNQTARHSPWIAWKNVLASKDCGGIGIGSLYALNRALFLKWRWRYVTQPKTFWVKMINHIHGISNQGTTFFSKCNTPGVWAKIVGTIKMLHDHNIIPMNKFRRVVNNGKSTMFWFDSWCSDIPLKDLYLRVFDLDSNKHCSVFDKWCNGWHFYWIRIFNGGVTCSHFDSMVNMLPSLNYSNNPDNWIWDNGNSNVYEVKDTRTIIDLITLPQISPSTRWCKYLPKKINILIWRISLDRIPTRWNMLAKGIDSSQILCPVCSICPENSFHSFWSCSLARAVWYKVSILLDTDLPDAVCIHDLMEWSVSGNTSRTNKDILEVIIGVIFWVLWTFQFRNESIHKIHSPIRAKLFDKIVFYSFLWYSNRNRKVCISWNNWMLNPLISSVL